MNTIIFTTKFLEYAVSDKDDVFVIQTTETVESLKERFEKHMIHFTDNVKKLTHFSNEASLKLSDYDFENFTPALKDFQDKYDACENFKKENYLFEVDGQYIDVSHFLYNGDINEYAIYSLDEWINMKLQETKNKPSYMT